MAAEPSGRRDLRENRARILDAASVVFAREQDPSLSDVAEESGLSRATVYRHFSDIAALREAMIDAVRQDGRDSITEHFFEPGISRGRPAQSTAEVLGAYLRKAFQMDSPYGHVVADEPEPGGGLIDEFLPITEAMIRHAQERGEFRTDIDVTLAAKAHLTLVLFAARRLRLDGEDLDDTVKIVEVFLRGLETIPKPVWDAAGE